MFLGKMWSGKPPNYGKITVIHILEWLISFIKLKQHQNK